MLLPRSVPVDGKASITICPDALKQQSETEGSSDHTPSTAAPPAETCISIVIADAAADSSSDIAAAANSDSNSTRKAAASSTGSKFLPTHPTVVYFDINLHMWCSRSSDPAIERMEHWSSSCAALRAQAGC
uniref:Uncharacterized protein n=1 Tax=Tetradesmus obliquus TaxID=3088 RepID=A0A383VP81_TETOB